MTENRKHKKIGLVASSFDLLHAGHCLMLKDAKEHCDYLIVSLQVDPSVDRPHKNKPILSLEERRILLQSNKYVDEIIVYHTETDLKSLLEKLLPDVRILGSDHEGKEITGELYCKEIYFHERDHDYSSTNIRRRILIEDLK